MRLRPTLGAALGAGAALFSLAACSSGVSQVAPSTNQGTLARARSFAAFPVGPISLAYPSTLRGDLLVPNRAALHIVDPASVKAQVDVSQYGTPSGPGEVNGYVTNNKKNKKPFCSIPGLEGVNALETDSTGNLWVGQVTASYVDEVVEYAPNCGKPGIVLNDPDGQPVDIAFGKTSMYVSDILGPDSGTVGNIAIYPNGSTSPTGELTNANVFFSLGVSVDSKGDVFQSYLGNSSGTAGGVLEFKGGKGGGTVLKGVKIDEPGVAFIDKNGNLIVPDQGAATLDTYKPPYTKLSSSFPLQAQSIQCAVDAAEDNVACADRANDTVDVYAYPSGTYQYSFENGLSPSLATIGIAQDPE